MESTKGEKVTKFKMSTELSSILKEWKKKQAKFLKSFQLVQTEEQFVFTYTDAKGNVNQRLHPDFLNTRLKKIEKKHKNLVHVYPHMLRHTFATLAKQGGATMTDISRSLTHSELSTTEIYVNTPDEVDLTTFNHFKNRLNMAKEKSHTNSDTNIRVS